MYGECPHVYAGPERRSGYKCFPPVLVYVCQVDQRKLNNVGVEVGRD